MTQDPTKAVVAEAATGGEPVTARANAGYSLRSVVRIDVSRAMSLLCLPE